jgi:mRNA interferase RelE/StbE
VTYRIEIKRSARKALLALPANMRQRLRAAIDELAIDPRPAGVSKITQAHALYRRRVGDYRIIYEILDDRLLVMVVKVGHRREVYR